MPENKYDLSGVLDTFFLESEELLEEMDSSLLNLEKNSDSFEDINAVFRAIHTIKGSSGMFELHEIVEFTHILENFLDNVRNSKIVLNEILISLIFDCADFVKLLLELYKNDFNGLEEDHEIQKNNLISRLNMHLEDEDIKESSNNGSKKLKSDKKETWHISLRFNDDIYKNGYDPYSFIKYLTEIGEISALNVVSDNIPSDETMDPELCYLGFEINFIGNVTKKELEDVFEFIIDDCDLKIIPPEGSIKEFKNLLNELPEENMQLGEILLNIGSLTEHELEMVLDEQKKLKENNEDKNLGDIIAEKELVSRDVVEAAVDKQTIRKAGINAQNIIKIKAEKLDTLINLVGELVISGSNVQQISEKKQDNDLSESVSTMSRLVEEIRDSTMNIRMVPIGDTFRKFNRIVRDLGKEFGKEVELIISGGETELDKTLIDKISDPILHLVRNSIDHGLDMPDEREKNGKSRIGHIYMDAYYETGNVVIEIADDGKGLNKERIYKQAVEKSLISEGLEISDNEIFNMIFEPGFSTAEKVTNISGRGVGMDVVRRNIEALRGVIVLSSNEDKGTSVKISLPLTLAIIDGFLVQVNESNYVIPLDMVVECTELNEKNLRHNEGGNFIDLRGSLLPYMRLRDFFEDEGQSPKKENVIVVEYGQSRAGFIIDKPIGELQTVIKPLGKIFSELKWISGSTILGSGDVALILDISRLIDELQSKQRKSNIKDAAENRAK